MSKLEKTLAKLEKRFEHAGPIEKAQLIKKANSIQRKLNKMRGE